MASLKIASLLLRTLSKPIATKIKQRAKDHEGFKSRTIAMAQFLHRAEMNLRVSLLGESPKHIRPLSESRAIESGANFLSEGFLFAVAATIILGETYRSRLSESKRRDAVRDSLESHEQELEQLRQRFQEVELERRHEHHRSQELGKIVEQVVQIGLKGGFGGDGNGLEEGGKSAWERHLRIAELARAFGTNGRVLREDDDEGDHNDEDTRNSPDRDDDEDARSRLERFERIGQPVRIQDQVEEDEEEAGGVSLRKGEREAVAIEASKSGEETQEEQRRTSEMKDSVPLTGGREPTGEQGARGKIA